MWSNWSKPSLPGRTTILTALLVTLFWLPWSVIRGSDGAPPALVSSQGAGGYGIAVTGADQDFIPGTGSSLPPEGRKWILVTASLHNLDGSTVVVDARALALIDQDDQRYSPDPSSQHAQPALVGASLAKGEWILGVALFEVPEGVIGEWLEWCPAGPDQCATVLRSPIPLTPSGRGPVPPPESVPGLRGEYYDTADLTALQLARVDPTVNFEWGTNSPDPSIAPDTFSVRWTGQVKLDFSETYTFSTISDDGVRLWVDGQLLIDHWTDHPATENSGTIALQAGQWYPILLEYYEGAGTAVMSLSYSSPSTPKQIISNDHLRAPSGMVDTRPAGPVVTGFRGMQEGQSLSGRVAIEALVSGANITQVVFQLSGPWTTSHTEGIAPYYFMGNNGPTPNGWDTTQYPDGEYTLTATATDQTGQSGSGQVRFDIANSS